MSNIIFKLKFLINYIRFLPLVIKYNRSSKRDIINLDIKRWLNEIDYESRKSNTSNLIYLLFLKPQFRNLFFFRIESHVLTCVHFQDKILQSAQTNNAGNIISFFLGQAVQFT